MSLLRGELLNLCVLSQQIICTAKSMWWWCVCVWGRGGVLAAAAEAEGARAGGGVGNHIYETKGLE